MPFVVISRHGMADVLVCSRDPAMGVSESRADIAGSQQNEHRAHGQQISKQAPIVQFVMEVQLQTPFFLPRSMPVDIALEIIKHISTQARSIRSSSEVSMRAGARR
jgi:hypothetical protein